LLNLAFGLAAARLPNDHDSVVSEDLVARLYKATEPNILEIAEKLTIGERAQLAKFCYQKCHLRRIGLAVAATCDLYCLKRHLGEVLGAVLYVQSRTGTVDLDPRRAVHENRITLARSSGTTFPSALDVDDEGIDQEPVPIAN
jgi:hypothetical protein